jgi:hypothetical protein
MRAAPVEISTTVRGDLKEPGGEFGLPCFYLPEGFQEHILQEFFRPFLMPPYPAENKVIEGFVGSHHATERPPSPLLAAA